MDSNLGSNMILHPKKGMWLAMFVCFILGIGSLLTWNSMLTIVDYYAYLFPEYHPTRILVLVFQPFSLLFVSILAYNEARINTRLRNLVGYTIFFLSSLAVIILDVASGGKGGIVPFLSLCVLSAAFGVGDALVQAGMVGDLSLMCPQLVQWFLVGSAASGVITSALRMVTKASFNSTNGLRKGALLFFGITCFLEFVCLILYATILPHLPIIKDYRSQAASEGSKTVYSDLSVAGLHHDQVSKNSPERLTNNQLLSKNKDYAVGIIVVGMISLSIFPGFISENTGKHSLGSWYAVVLIGVYNLWNLLGRCTPRIKYLKIESRKWLMVAIWSRSIFIPAFYIAEHHGGQTLMIILTSLLGLSNGHFTVRILTEAPKGYKAPEKNALGNMLIVFFLWGMFIGAMLNWLWLIGKGW
ncbi:Equilibrative nucleotide transporter 3 [Zostera marina]|uniref:Equilibrative nucleotide transporter 3 n=1 Tax=Zostera marina TaxID=29655 RepID=A0A0K9PIH2_ZOSMR|nr:Equilibrative nucleotide transporter 3 [Zostera marina]